MGNVIDILYHIEYLTAEDREEVFSYNEAIDDKDDNMSNNNQRGENSPTRL